MNAHPIVHRLEGLRHHHAPAPFFEDRVDAGRQLAAMVGVPSAAEVAVVGVGPGGGVVAAEVARALGVPLATTDEPDLDGRRVYLVDDGIVTGATMTAAVAAVRAARPREIVVATPVASVDGLRVVLREATETMCLHTVARLASVAECYRDLAPVEAAPTTR